MINTALSPWTRVFQSEPGCRKPVVTALAACTDFWRTTGLLRVSNKALCKLQSVTWTSTLVCTYEWLLCLVVSANSIQPLSPEMCLKHISIPMLRPCRRCQRPTWHGLDGQVSMVEVVGNDHCVTLLLKPFLLKCSKASAKNCCTFPQPQYHPVQETGGEHDACYSTPSTCQAGSFKIYIHTLHKDFGIIKKDL